MPLERELKLSADFGLPDLTGLSELAGYPLRYLGLERQDNTYYDTAAGALRAAGATLRVREVAGLGGARVLTFKGAGSAEGGVVSREEIECPAPQSLAAAADVPDAAARGALEAVAADSPLEVVAGTRTARRLYELSGLGELTLDTVEVVAPDGSVLASFEEVEVEAKGEGADASLASVRATLEALAPLRPSRAGKFSRALEVLAARSSLGPEAGWASFAGRTIAAELDRLRAFAPVAAAGLDPEGVHGMRVATRRLRSALRLFREALQDTTHLGGELRWLAGVLGAVRDLDVLSAGLPRLAERAGVDDDALAPAASLLAADRREARATLVRTLGSGRYRALLAEAAALVGGLDGAPGMTLGEAAGPALDGILRSFRSHARKAAPDGSSSEDLHALRKAAKRLRYSLEFLEPAAPDAVAAATSDLRDLQEELGRLNDDSSAVRVLGGLAGRLGGPDAYQLGRVVGRLEERCGRDADRVRRRLRGVRVGAMREGLQAAFR